MTTTITRPPESFDLLDLLANEPHPMADADRECIINAVIEAAEADGGKVTTATIRERLGRTLDRPARFGAIVSGLVARHILVEIPGMTARSMDAKNRNSNRLKPWYRVADWNALRAEVTA